MLLAIYTNIYIFSVLKHGDLPWNYGALPQTWEAPDLRLFDLKDKGDEDPVDVVELGAPRNVGDVLKVKVLGAFCLIDQGEADWKVIAINIDDPLANAMNSTLVSDSRFADSNRHSRRRAPDARQARRD